MPNSGRQESGSSAKSLATFGFGALVGAVAAGALWYFNSEDEQQQPQRQQQSRYYTSNHPANRPSSPANLSASQQNTGNNTEKDETVQICEICLVSFNELKESGIKIVATPCGHVYCRDCIIGSLTIKPECPHCRNPVQEGSLRQLFL